MARFVSQHQKDIGISPFELRFKGKKRSDKVHIRIIDFNSENLQELEISDVADLEPFRYTKTISWINIDGLHEEEIVAKVGEVFELDRVLLADVLNTNLRPKVVEYDECLFVSLKMMRFEETTNKVRTENVSFILADRLLISFQESRGDVFEPVRERIRKQKKKLRESNVDYLIFTLLDIVIDNYIYILSLIGERIESLEDVLLRNPSENTLEAVNTFKREINFLRKNILPAREMVNALAKIDSEILDQDVVGIHFKELQNNINQAVETSDSYREILSDLLNIYHTTISAKLNDVMKFLTIFSVIFIPLTFIAGIYGTNFDNLPELHYQYSYYIMWGVMVLITTGMVIYFRHRGWM